MASLSFEGETHGELVVKVRRWLASVEGDPEAHLTRTEAVEQGAELTKEALRVIASAAPKPVAQSDVVKALTGSPWGTFTVMATIPIALFMGIYSRYIRVGRIGEISFIGFILLMLAIVGGQWVHDSPTLGPMFTFTGTDGSLGVRWGGWSSL